MLDKFLFNSARILHAVGFPDALCWHYNQLRHHYVMKRIIPYLDFAYKRFLAEKKSTDLQEPKSKQIWTVWWQGEEKAPFLIQQCIHSLRKAAGEHKLNVITLDNVKQYTTIPDYIYEKVELGKISMTHFSDIFRFNIIREQGGLFADSTVLYTRILPEKYFANFFTCSGFKDRIGLNISAGRWTGFLIGGDKASDLFVFMDEFYRHYWETHDTIDDYFLVDYALAYAYNKDIGGLRTYSEKYASINNPELLNLECLMNRPFDKNNYEMLQQKTEAFKLSNKHKYEDVIDTYYDVLVKKMKY